MGAVVLEEVVVVISHNSVYETPASPFDKTIVAVVSVGAGITLEVNPTVDPLFTNKASLSKEEPSVKAINVPSAFCIFHCVVQLLVWIFIWKFKRHYAATCIFLNSGESILTVLDSSSSTNTVRGLSKVTYTTLCSISLSTLTRLIVSAGT